MAEYRAVFGIVQFPPREGDAAGKKVRNIVVNQVGFGQQAVPVYATLWPSHKDFAVEENDVVILEGKYSSRKTEKDGEPITYHNLSVLRAKNLGAVDAGAEPDTDSNDVEPESDDDIPY